MTQAKKFKGRVRARQAQTGERYTQAREVVESERPVQPEAPLGRVLGLETKYLVRFPLNDVPDERAARHMLRRIPHGVFLDNGARLYLDERGQPEYATAECDSVDQVVASQRAGHEFMAKLNAGTHPLLQLFTSPDAPCHENYSTAASTDLASIAHAMASFLVTRIVLTGTGRETDGRFVLSPRAAAVTSVAGSDRFALVDTNVSALADPQRFARLHVSASEANRTDEVTWLRVATTELVLRTLERMPSALDGLVLADPIASLRVVNEDADCTALLDLADGRRMRAVDVQSAVLQRCVPDDRVKDAWSRALDDRSSAEWTTPTPYLNAVRVTGATDPPLTTRAALRAAFVRAARQHGRDYTVDWVHLKLYDERDRTVLCKDPTVAEDERVQRLIATMSTT